MPNFKFILLNETPYIIYLSRFKSIHLSLFMVTHFKIADSFIGICHWL